MADGGSTGDSRPNSRLTQDQLMDYVQDVTGWNTYHAAAYVTLVRDGPLEAGDIVAMTDIPQGRIYDILGELEGDAVNVQGGHPKRYKAQHPRSILGEKQEEFNEKANQATSHLEQQHEIQRERRESQHPAWVVPGIGGTKRELREALDEATDRVLVIDEDGNWIQDNQIRDLSRLTNSGVEVEVIGWRSWRDKLQQLTDKGVSVWESEQIDSSVCIIDNEFAMLRVGRGNTGIKIEDEGTVNTFQVAFRTLQQEATEFDPS